MTRLHFVVEGQTEERFAKDVLVPHFVERCMSCSVSIISTLRQPRGGKQRGGGHWRHWLQDIRAFGAGRSTDVWITTLFDLYGRPADSPSRAEVDAIADTTARAVFLEEAMRKAVGDPRFIPYVQRHEFESLVFAALDRLEGLLEGEQRNGLAKLRVQTAGAEPEDIDDGRETAPSKRLMQAIPGYRKLTHGVLAVKQAGLPQLRARCPRFDAWIARLEALLPSRGHET